MKDPERILVFNVNWLGDVLFSTACLRAIRQNYPESFIACIVPPRCLPVLEGNPNLDEIICFDEKGRHRGPLALLRFIVYLRRKHFDTAFLLHRSFSRTLIVALAGIRRRIGYYTKKRGFLLTQSFIAPPVASMHRIDYYLTLLRQAGLEVADRVTEFFVRQEDIKSVEDFLISRTVREDDFIVSINPGGNWDPKRWPRQNFAALADQIAAAYKAKIIITGSLTDEALARDISSRMRTQPVIACGALSLKQFAVLARVSDLFITADSGPLHIANAAGARRIIALFGPTDPALTGPVPLDNVTLIRKDIGCTVPCYEVDCPDNRCMKAITVEDVMRAVRTAVEES